jgi:hypothetical protein
MRKLLSQRKSETQSSIQGVSQPEREKGLLYQRSHIHWHLNLLTMNLVARESLLVSLLMILPRRPFKWKKICP